MTYEHWIHDCIAWHEMRVEQTHGRVKRRNMKAITRFRRLLR